MPAAASAAAPVPASARPTPRATDQQPDGFRIMQLAEIYAWLTAIPHLGCDGFDAHVTASILSLSLWEAETGRLRPTDAIGLDGSELVGLAKDLFPHAATVFAHWESEAASPPTEDEACLRELLRRNATRGSPFQCRLADMVARRCLRPNHLWQDLGLRN